MDTITSFRGWAPGQNIDPFVNTQNESAVHLFNIQDGSENNVLVICHFRTYVFINYLQM